MPEERPPLLSSSTFVFTPPPPNDPLMAHLSHSRREKDKEKALCPRRCAHKGTSRECGENLGQRHAHMVPYQRSVSPCLICVFFNFVSPLTTLLSPFRLRFSQRHRHQRFR